MKLNVSSSKIPIEVGKFFFKLKVKIKFFQVRSKLSNYKISIIFNQNSRIPFCTRISPNFHYVQALNFKVMYIKPGIKILEQ